MNKLLVCAAAAAVFGAAAFAAIASAQTAPPTAAPQPHATMTAAHVTRHDARTVRAVPAPGSRSCLRSTGSLIPPPKGRCLPVPGNSYSQQDLLRTGQTNIGRALQMLDPSVTINGH